MWIRRCLAAVTVGVVLVGCGHQASQRAAVATYLKKVNKVEAALTRPLGVVTRTGNQFAQEQKSGGTLTNLVTASHERALLSARSRIVTLRARLAAIKTPPVARHLRSLLLQILDRQAALTLEVEQLIAFLPSYSAALRPLQPATLRLEVALSQRSAPGPAAVAAVYANKARALRQFKAVTESVLAHVRTLRPPPVSRPDYHGQIVALQGMGLNAGRLAAALQNGPQGNVQQLLAQFDRAAAANQTLAAQKARIAALRAYDGQSVKLVQLARAAEEERLHLANGLS